MAAFYTDENIPLPVVEALRSLGHDVVTAFEAGHANQRIADPAVLAHAVGADRALVTHNRRDFIKLHTAVAGAHAGIVVCSVDADSVALASRIDARVTALASLSGQLIRIDRQQST